MFKKYVIIGAIVASTIAIGAAVTTYTVELSGAKNEVVKTERKLGDLKLLNQTVESNSNTHVANVETLKIALEKEKKLNFDLRGRIKEERDFYRVNLDKNQQFAIKLQAQLTTLKQISYKENTSETNVINCINEPLPDDVIRLLQQAGITTATNEVNHANSNRISTGSKLDLSDNTSAKITRGNLPFRHAAVIRI